MSEINATKPPVWFWILAVLFVLWNLMGVANYLMSVTATPESLTAQGMDAAQIEFMLNIPPLYAAVFALAVWTGLAASILFILRRRLAVPAFLISLLFVLSSFAFDFIGGTFEVLGTPYLMIMIFVVVAAVVEYFYARRVRGLGFLR